MTLHNGLFVECEVLDNFRGLVVQGQGLVNWSSRTRTFLEDIDIDTYLATINYDIQQMIAC